MDVSEEAVGDFLEHHGVTGMKKGFPKTNLDRVSRIARGTAKLQSTIKKVQSDAVKNAGSVAAKVQAQNKARLVVDAGPTKVLPNVKVKKPNSTDGDTGESLTIALLAKHGKIRVVDLGK